MENILEVIDNRRSVRKFRKQKVEKEKLDLILHAAIFAPTALNRQSLFFVILTDDKIKEELFNRIDVRKNFYNCDSILFVFAREDDVFNELNCGAAIENALLMATSLSVSSCWIHSAREKLNTPQSKEALKDLLDLSKEYQALDAIALGYIDGDMPESKVRRIDGDKII